ncbi:MAG: EAL domain-containing protein [Gammaproteobacteria bacterium]|nr:EAL domain-containing protein [Gammaproteobacteria bacterium]MDH3768627.1 EAL domain-containing protein [Gammaproteobacteria bacterium]
MQNILKKAALELTGRFRYDADSIQQPTPRAERVNGLALIATADPVSRVWGPRWLGHTGLEVRLAGSASELESLLDSEQPSLVMIDAALRSDSGERLYARVKDMLCDAVPVIALCSNNKEVRAATNAGVTDIARRPFDWQLIAQRVVHTVRACQERTQLARVRDELESAVRDAHNAHDLFTKTRGLDKLTRLPNRERFRRLLHTAIGVPPSMTHELGVLVLGIERFGTINDAVGQGFGDELLVQFGDRLKACMQDRELIGIADGRLVTAFAARLGGVRFALALSNCTSAHIRRARQILAAEMSRPFEVGGHSIYLSVSVGAAVFPKDSTDGNVLLHCAESAMLEAKRGGTGFRLHEQPADSASARKLALDTMLRSAIDNRELRLAYQPIVATDTGLITGAEALLRWDHPIEGAISPAEFVPVAEESGLMVEIGRFVIREACRQLREWIDQGYRPIRIAVNLSLCHLLRGDVIAVVEEALAANRLEPQLLEFEFSERGVLTRHPEVVAEVSRLKAIGVRTSIDDFGTGDASIAYLKDLPVDVIKIDRSYISGVGVTAREAAIASGIVVLAQRLQASVIGEGVETEKQLEMLREWGCEECQGFYFSPAVPPGEFTANLIKT